MASSNPMGLAQPLSVGNVVSAGLRLYRDRFKDYIVCALYSVLWSVLPFLVLILLAVFVGVAVSASSNFAALLALLIPAWIVLFVYCVARSYARNAAIARMAYGDLTQQPETPDAATRFTRSRMWSFLLMNLIVGLIYFAVVIALYITLAIVLGILLASVGGFDLSSPESLAVAIGSNPSTAITFGLVVLVLLLVVLVAFLWLGARFSVTELPLAVETETDALKSVGRSWSLTKHNVWRIALIVFVAALITLPLYIAYFIISGIVNAVLLSLYSADSSTYEVLSSLIGYPINLIVGLIAIPFWQAIRAVIYYDLRGRREGLGLNLPDRPV